MCDDGETAPEIVFVDRFIIAEIRPDGHDALVELRRSPRVKLDDPWMAPVMIRLADRCVTEESKTEVRDTRWMGHRYEYTRYRIFGVCPGISVEHFCPAQVLQPMKG